ncbi:unnamed protein product, partial [Ixodes pacificus]
MQNYVARPKATMKGVRPPPIRQPLNRKVFISEDLDTSTHIFVRTDALRKLLQAPCDGPFFVIQRGPKTFLLDLPSKKKGMVSVDRLKPAYIESVQVSPQAPLTSALRHRARLPTKSSIFRHMHWETVPWPSRRGE